MSEPSIHDDALDAALRQQLQDVDAEPLDDGFSLRVMAALPARTAPRAPAASRVAQIARWAHWSAISAAALGVALLLSGGEPLEPSRAIAATVLIGLLVVWSLPSRWSRG